MSPFIRRQQWRPFWLKLHLYLGLSFGLVFVLAGITGSLLVFYVDIDELINPTLHINPAPTTTPKSYEEVLTALNQAHPQRDKAWRMEIPRQSTSMIMARYYKPQETEHLHFAPLIVWVNPYTAKVVSNRFWGQYLMTWIYDLHYTLLLDLTGKTIMAVVGGFLLISLITGVYLWWPHPGKLKSAFTFKPHTSFSRFNYDLHKISAIYSLIFMLLLIMSGILLELPDFFNPIIHRLSPLYTTQPNLSNPQQRFIRIPVDTAVAIAQNTFPNAQLRWIETPKDKTGSYCIILYQYGEPSKRFPKTTVWINQYDGTVLDVRNPMVDNSAGDTFLNWLHPLHSGEIAGLTGRLFVLLSGIIPTILYSTGFIRWLQKRKAKKLKAYKFN